MRLVTVSAVVAAILVAAAPASAQNYVKWKKFEKSFAEAAAADKPVLVYCGSIVKDGTTKDLGPVNRAWDGDKVRAKAGKFIFTRVTSTRTLAQIRPKSKGEVVFLEPDGTEIHRVVVSNEEDILSAMSNALAKYSPREIEWQDWTAELAAEAKTQKKLIVLAFYADSAKSTALLKLLEAASIVKYHERCLFLRIPYSKTSEQAKLWGVRAAPTILAVNPFKKQGRRAAIQNLTGTRKLPHVKLFMTKAFRSLERDKDWKAAKDPAKDEN